MIWEDQVFIVDVVVTDLTQEMVASSVISWPKSVVADRNPIVKIHKYKGFHEGHHFISITMEVHGAPRCDMDCFIKECAYLFHDKRSKVIYPCFFFSSNMLLLLFNVL
jgi:hypothetical protein